MDMKYLPLFPNWFPIIRCMETGAEVADFLEAAFEYHQKGTFTHKVSKMGQATLEAIRPVLDKAKERWMRKSAVNKRNGLKGADARWHRGRAKNGETDESVTDPLPSRPLPPAPPSSPTPSSTIA